MKESPSAYGGIAAVLVLGLGLLIVGLSLPPERHEQAVGMRWAGAVALVLGLVVMAVTLSQTPARKALYAAIGAMVYTGFFAYNAASNEITGTATYHLHVLAKGDKAEAVTRDTSPVKFRKATNFLWGGSGVCLGIAVIGLALNRKLEE
jgi:hypothetical protein